MLVFDIKNCWKYKDESIIKKTKEFIEENKIEGELVVSYRVLKTITVRFSKDYVGSLYNHICKTFNIKLKGESNPWCERLEEKEKKMKVKLLNGAPLPKQMRQGDAGYDFYLPEDVKIKPRHQVAIDTNVCVEIPEHHAGLFALRGSSCLNEKHLHLKNPLADSNFRGSLHLIVYNDSFFRTIRFKKGQRIASLFVFPIYDKPLEQVEELSESNRGDKWNGSSGM